MGGNDPGGSAAPKNRSLAGNPRRPSSLREGMKYEEGRKALCLAEHVPVRIRPLHRRACATYGEQNGGGK